uniref:Mitochondrial ornithine transporter 1 n=2 Tax=Mesocestoides corti TaxID=53468 RepID=A0A5K3ETQ3_MESCO
MNHMVESAIGLVAGINGGVTSVLVSQPLDTVKVKMQTFPELYRSATRCFSDVCAKDGIMRGLYAGTFPALAASIAENAVVFCALPSCQKAVANLLRVPDTNQLSPLHHGFAGALTGIFSALALCPTEFVKCRVQAFNEMNFLDPKHGFPMRPAEITRQTLHKEGLIGLYRGFSPTLVREMLGLFVYFGTYELIRDWMTPVGRRKSDLGILPTALAGGLSGASLWLAIFPFDVVKSRMQIGHLVPSVQMSKSSPRLLNTLCQIRRTEGRPLGFD